jgi:small subunit ribosomal protein S20
LANIKSAAKKARQAEKHRQHNAALRTRMRTAVKKASKTIKSGNVAEAKTAYGEVAPAVDRLVSKGLIHRNKAARHKSRLNKALKALSAKS